MKRTYPIHPYPIAHPFPETWPLLFSNIFSTDPVQFSISSKNRFPLSIWDWRSQTNPISTCRSLSITTPQDIFTIDDIEGHPAPYAYNDGSTHTDDTEVWAHSKYLIDFLTIPVPAERRDRLQVSYPLPKCRHTLRRTWLGPIRLSWSRPGNKWAYKLVRPLNLRRHNVVGIG